MRFSNERKAAFWPSASALVFGGDGVFVGGFDRIVGNRESGVSAGGIRGRQSNCGTKPHGSSQNACNRDELRKPPYCFRPVSHFAT